MEDFSGQPDFALRDSFEIVCDETSAGFCTSGANRDLDESKGLDSIKTSIC